MIHRSKRITSVMLVLVLVLSVLAGAVPANAATGTKIYNTGTRDETCTSLSAQAIAYYTGDYTWENLSVLEGGNQDCTYTDNALFEALNKLMTDTMEKSVTYKKLKDNYPYSDAIDGSDDNYGMFYSGVTYTHSTDDKNVLYNTISREHVWPKSHASFHLKNGGCDLHHLRPEYSSVNSARNNYILGNVKGVYSNCSTYKYENNIVFYTYGSDKTSSGRCEVPDNVKGDVARILLYVWCRWEQPNLFMDISDPQVDSSDNKDDNKNDGIRVIESLETLLQWCKDDPVDTWEMGRNDAAERIQGNRNVFIDYPEMAWLVFGLDVPEDVTTPSGNAGTSGNPSSGNSSDNIDSGDDSGISVVTPTLVTTPTADTSFKLRMDTSSSLYFNGDVYREDLPWYLGSTGSVDDATDIYVEEVEGGYRLYFNRTRSNKTYICMYQASGRTDASLCISSNTADCPAGCNHDTVFTWDDTHHTFVATVAGEQYYIGTNSKDYTSFSANPISGIDSGYVSHLYTLSVSDNSGSDDDGEAPPPDTTPAATESATEPTTAPSDSSDNSSDNNYFKTPVNTTAVFTILIILLLLLLGGTPLFFLRRRKSGKRKKRK